MSKSLSRFYKKVVAKSSILAIFAGSMILIPAATITYSKYRTSHPTETEIASVDSELIELMDTQKHSSSFEDDEDSK